MISPARTGCAHLTSAALIVTSHISNLMQAKESSLHSFSIHGDCDFVAD